MAIQYKPTKQKQEKPAKASKMPKAEKTMKFSPTAQKVKTSKPPKPEKIKAPKPEKAKALSFGKAAKVSGSEKTRKAFNPKVAVAIVAAVIAITAVVLAVAIPASQRRGMEIDYIQITQKPDKLVYLTGEEANYDGLRVTVFRKNGESFVVRASDCEITGFKSDSAMESRIITVSYQGHNTYLSLKFIENEKPKPILESIYLEPMPKTEYRVGEWLNTDGAYIIRVYADGTTSKVTLVNTDVYGWDKVDAPGTYELTVAYEENGVLCTYKYTITVTE